MNGIICKIESEPRKRALPARLYAALWGLLLYAALWGGLCSMAFLSVSGLTPLIPGGVLALALVFAPDRKRLWLRLALLGVFAACGLFFARYAASTDGVKLFLNRLFAASEARQAYTYDKFTVSPAAGIAELRYALIPFGLVAGALCGVSARLRLRLIPALLFALWAGAAAWLGISPAAFWCVLPVIALGLAFSERFAVLLPAALLCAAVLFAFPGEDARLSAWDEAARDTLAPRTVAYADEQQYQALQTPQTQPASAARPDRTADDSPDIDAAWLHVLPRVLIVLLPALALFLPAIASDRLRKRRERNRAGLDDPDNAAAVRAMFLYALRWLRLGGLETGNRPCGACAGELEALYSPELRAEFESVLPLWQEAAYSAHAIGDAQRARMRTFMELTRETVWDGLRRRDRLRAKYIEAL